MKKCLKIGLPNLKSVSGNFVNDLIEVSDILFLVFLHFQELKYLFSLLQGPVALDFGLSQYDQKASIYKVSKAKGFAKNGFLVGILRFFEEENEIFLNATYLDSGEVNLKISVETF